MKGGPSYCFEAEPGKILTHKALSTRALRTRVASANVGAFETAVHRVTRRADLPERIAAEWWRRLALGLFN